MMKKWYLLLLLILPVSAFSQTVYKDFEVDSVAQPRGGRMLLEKFIEVNRRIPYSAQVNKVTGTVVVAGVVEPTGAISNVKVMRSLHPDCDREAVRTFRFFNAWKPALKGGSPVPQQVVYQIKFAPTQPHSAPGAMTDYFTKAGSLAFDEKDAEYRLVTPVDTLGIPTAKPVVFQRRGSSWKQVDEYGFDKEQFIQYRENDFERPDSIPVTRQAITNPGGQLQGPVYTLFPDGSVASRELYSNGQRTGLAVYYYRNGLAKRVEESLDSNRVQEWTWYPNGQIRQVRLYKMYTLLNRIASQWDSSGLQTVKEGNGSARLVSWEDAKCLVESGAVKDGFKDGLWTGQFMGGGLQYREQYANGTFLSGVSFEANGDSLRYNEPEKLPEFKGGLPALGQFLSRNIRYPEEAMRAQVQGRVFVTFIIDPVGKVVEVSAFKRLGSGADEEAVRVVKATDGLWNPAVRRGRKISVRYNLPINFATQ